MQNTFETPSNEAQINNAEVAATAEISSSALQALNESATKIQTLNMTAYSELTALEMARKQWEQTELLSSHQRLYSMLTSCYQYFVDMKNDPSKDVRSAKTSALEVLIKERDYKFKSDTNDINKIVQCVFGLERRRVSAYASALRTALVSGRDASGKVTPVSPSDLATWIEGKGGIEEIRCGKKSSEKLTEEKRVVEANSFLSNAIPIKLKVDIHFTELSIEHVDRQVLLIGTYRNTGEVEISGVVKNDSAVRTALAAYHREHSDVMKTDQSTKAIEADEALKRRAIEAAVAAATR